MINIQKTTRITKNKIRLFAFAGVLYYTVCIAKRNIVDIEKGACKMKVLITGGAGYIGSTVASALEDAGHTPIILDSLVHGPRAFVRDRIFYHGDIADRALVKRIFEEHPDIFCTVHCAALILVPESMAKPYEYYTENVAKSLELFRSLRDFGYPRVIFSSSASVYGSVEGTVYEVDEQMPLNPASPYARTKYMMEMILRDFCNAYGLRGIALRYFNPIGADPQLRSGMYAKNPSHILGQLLMVANGEKETFTITGTDWPTRDGTGIRDYIHLWDLAQAHLAAVLHFDEALEKANEPYAVINIGAGNGVTVRELLDAFQRVIGHPISVTEGPARPGDPAGAYASAQRAAEWLGWRAELSVDQAIDSALRWEKAAENILAK